MSFFKKIDFLVIGFTRPIITFFLIYVGYLLIGSLCFVMLESTHELEDQNKTIQSIRLTQAMVKRLKEANYSDGDISQAFHTQHLKKKKSVVESLAWYHVFGEKFFFAFILITTIGYGNVTPKSLLGKSACVIYTMIGLPIHATMMRLFSVKFRGALRKTFKVVLRFFPGSRIALVFFGFVYFFFWIAILLFIPACYIMFRESWEYSQAFYFSYVSLTTIGLGDYVSGFPDRQGALYALNVVLIMIWLFFGLAFVTMTVNMFSYILGLYTLDKLDCKCRERSAALVKLKVLLDLMNELNWQLIKGKPDNFENWDEVEKFRNLLAENPQDVTPEMLRRIFGITVDLKEKAYDQISRMQFLTIPTSPFLERARENLPDIRSSEVSASSFDISKEKEIHNKTPSTSQIVQEPETLGNTQVGNSASQTDFVHTGSFEQEPTQERQESVVPLNATGIVSSDIIEDRRENFFEDNNKPADSERNDRDSSESEEKSNDEDENKNEDNKSADDEGKDTDSSKSEKKFEDEEKNKD